MAFLYTGYVCTIREAKDSRERRPFPSSGRLQTKRDQPVLVLYKSWHASGPFLANHGRSCQSWAELMMCYFVFAVFLVSLHGD
ncbi:unnamed protein product [Ascophyllum nodosum]